VTPVLLLAALGSPLIGPAPTQVRHDVFPGPRLIPGLVHYQHPAVRFANEWLKDHRLRGRRFTLAKPEGTARVLALGSSSTWGHGLPDGLDWPTILEKLLQQRDPERQVEVLNGGIRSTSAARALRVFTEVLLSFDPDVVVISFYFNDAYFLTQLDEDSVLAELAADDYVHDSAGKRRVRERVIEGKARLARLLGAAQNGQDLGLIWSRLAGDEPSPPQRFEALLRTYVRICADRGIDVILLKEPLRDDAPRLWKQEFHAAIDRVAADHDVVVIDPRLALAARDSGRMFMDIVHPLPPGCLVIAEELAPAIEGLLDRR
jgi:lysophospholipase L1-like esterase